MQSRLGTTIGAVAQVVEQWTENPCVAGSTPASTTLGPLFFSGLFCFYFWVRPSRALKMGSGAAGAVHSLRSRLFCGPLKMRRVPEEPVFGTEYLFRTGNACFLHRMLPKMRRVHREAFLSTARIFRTVEACFWYRVLSHRGILVDLFVVSTFGIRPFSSECRPFSSTPLNFTDQKCQSYRNLCFARLRRFCEGCLF